MSIQPANSAAYKPVSGSVTHTLTNFNVPAGDNRLLVLKIAIASSTISVSSVTYGSQSLTKTDGAAATMRVAGTGIGTEIWTVVAPTVGSANFTVTLSAAGIIGAIAETWTGVSQTTPLGTYASATGSSTTPSVDVTSATDEMVIDCSGTRVSSTSHTVTVGASQTQIADTSANSFYATGSVSNRISASYESGATTTTMSWTASASANWATGGVPIKPETSGGGGTTPPTPPAGATLGVGIAEVSIVPRRAAPNMSPSSASGTIGTLENNQADWEASGMFPKVLQGTLVGDQIIWDDVYTVPSVAPAGAISISALPTQNSPTASLIVATQDKVVQYPLPVSGSPTTTAYPQLPLAATTTAEAQAPENLLPVFYPSAYDAGGRLLELVAVQCVGQNFTDGTDAWAISVRPDDTEPWSTAQRQKQAEAMFFMESKNFGRVWRIAAQILDGDQDDPIGPSGSQIIGWFREIDADPGVYSQRARAIPEVS